MEKKKKGKAGKTLLLCAAVLLAAAVGVALTLAYLTATTDTMDNVFIPMDTTMSALWIEPKSRQSRTYMMSPGDQIDKDPMIVNTTDTDNGDIYVGAKASFYVDVGDGSGEFEVDYETFAKLVDVGNLSGTGWVDITSDAVGTGTDNARYYFYSVRLAKGDGNLPSYDGTAVAHYSESDNTTPLFTSVKVNPNIRIDTLTEVEVAAGRQYVAKADILKSNHGFTLGTGSAAMQKVFRGFDFNIKLIGVGVKASSTDVANANAETEAANAKAAVIAALKAL